MEKEVILVPVIAGVVLKKDNRYLLVQENKGKAYGLWNFPAGRVDIGDTIEETAIKEAREEAGLEVRLIKKLPIHQHEATTPPKHAFLAEITGGELNFPKDEIMDARWFTFAEIKNIGNKLRSAWILDTISGLEN